MRIRHLRFSIVALAALSGGYAFQSAACTADVFRAFAENLDPNNSDDDEIDFGEWLADEVDDL